MGWNWKYLLILSLIHFFSKGVKVWSTQTTGPRIGIGAKSLEELNRKIRLKFDLGEVWLWTTNFYITILNLKNLKKQKQYEQKSIKIVNFVSLIFMLRAAHQTFSQKMNS